MYALTTHQLQVERREREREPIKWKGIIRRPGLTKASGGNLAMAQRINTIKINIDNLMSGELNLPLPQN